MKRANALYINKKAWVAVAQGDPPIYMRRCTTHKHSVFVPSPSVRVRLRCKSMPGRDSQSRETRGARHHNGASQLDTAAAGAMENIILLYYCCCCCAKGGPGVVVRGDVGGRKKKKSHFQGNTLAPLNSFASRDEKNRRSNVPSLQLFSRVLLYNNNNIKRCVYDNV